MALSSYTAADLFKWVTTEGNDFIILDVRVEEQFDRFKVEGPYLGKVINVPYVEFVEKEADCVAKVPRGETIRIVCAREGSARYVAEILVNHGFEDVRYLAGGIKTWGNLLAPKLICTKNDYRLYQFIRPGKASCSYGLIYDDEMMVFDPSRNTDFYRSFAAENECRIVKSFETHLQADYISGSKQLALNMGADIIAHADDFKNAAFAYAPVEDQKIYTFSKGGPLIKALHMPGHTPGSTAYLIDNTFLTTGDTIFILSIGRPDLGGKVEEWSKLLFKTLKSRIADLDQALTILPGHYMDWSEANQELIFADTMGSIRNKNAHIYGIEKENDFIDFIKENMRPQPEVYAEIRKVNAGLLEVDDEKQDVMDLGKNECAASMRP